MKLAAPLEYNGKRYKSILDREAEQDKIVVEFMKKID